MLNGLFQNVAEKEKSEAIEGIIQHASPRQDFFLMVTLAIAMASFGVLLDSNVILIGSMLLAPILFPLLSLAMGIVMADQKIIGRSFYTLIKSVAFALAGGFIIGIFFLRGSLDSVHVVQNILNSQTSIMYVIVAAISGFAAAFAVTKPDLNETLPGVAIAVALMPPLAVAGIGLAAFNWAVISSSLLLFLANVFGVVVSAVIVFSLFGFAEKKKVARDAVKEEDRVIKKESIVKPADKQQKRNMILGNGVCVFPHPKGIYFQ